MPSYELYQQLKFPDLEQAVKQLLVILVISLTRKGLPIRSFQNEVNGRLLY